MKTGTDNKKTEPVEIDNTQQVIGAFITKTIETKKTQETQKSKNVKSVVKYVIM